jgi:hypothetical protein
MLVLALVSLAASRRKRSLTDIGLLGTAALLPFLAGRFVPLSVIIAPVVIAPDVKSGGPPDSA